MTYSSLSNLFMMLLHCTKQLLYCSCSFGLDISSGLNDSGDTELECIRDGILHTCTEYSVRNTDYSIAKSVHYIIILIEFI